MIIGLYPCLRSHLSRVLIVKGRFACDLERRCLGRRIVGANLWGTMKVTVWVVTRISSLNVLVKWTPLCSSTAIQVVLVNVLFLKGRWFASACMKFGVVCGLIVLACRCGVCAVYRSMLTFPRGLSPQPTSRVWCMVGMLL